MTHKNIPKDFIRLAAKREYIEERLGVEKDSKEYWDFYRWKVQEDLRKQKVRGGKFGGWYIHKDDFEAELKEAEDTQKYRKVTKKTKISIDEVKQILKDMKSVDVQGDKIVNLLMKKLGI